MERATGSGAFAEIASLGADAKSYDDVGLMAGTIYNYRVRAHGAGGFSAYSNADTAQTPMVLLPPNMSDVVPAQTRSNSPRPMPGKIASP